MYSTPPPLPDSGNEASLHVVTRTSDVDGNLSISFETVEVMNNEARFRIVLVTGQ
jgi:hypothetical protein